MVIKFLKIISIIIFVLILFISCDFISSSPFPKELMDDEIEKSLRNYIPRGDYLYSMHMLDDDYIFFIIQEDTGATWSKLLIMDNMFNIVMEYDNAEDGTWQFGDFNVIDSSSRYVIGNMVFDDDFTTLFEVEDIGNAFDKNYIGIVHDYNNYSLVVDDGTPDSLQRYKFKTNWGGDTSNIFTIDTGGDFDIKLAKNVIHNNSKGVLLVFEDNSNNNLLTIIIPEDEFDSPAVDLIDNYDNFRLYNIDFNKGIKYIDTGIIVQTNDGISELYNLDGNLIDSNSRWIYYDTVQTYDIDGGYYYVFDIDTTKIYRCDSWW